MVPPFAVAARLQRALCAVARQRGEWARNRRLLSTNEPKCKTLSGSQRFGSYQWKDPFALLEKESSGAFKVPSWTIADAFVSACSHGLDLCRTEEGAKRPKRHRVG